MKLEKIAQVMIGVLAKRENIEGGKNSYQLFSLKNYEDKKEYETLKSDKDLSDKVAKKGDLIFRLLYPNKIIYADEELQELLIPSQFCIIRPYKEKMSSIVLKWYLESEVAKESLQEKVTGSIIQSMPVASLKTIEIPEIEMQKQREMEEMITLWEKEKDFSKKIIEKKERLYNYYLETMMK